MDIDDIETIVVLGAGTMGHGIAEVVALGGYSVILRDISTDLVQRGFDQIEWSLGKLVEKQHITETESSAALDRISCMVDIEDALKDADFVIEAVPEKRSIKADVYEDIGRYAPKRTIVATNTSSMSISELAKLTDRPAKFCGMHFFNPPVRMALVEVIRGDQTDDETLELAASLARALGKDPVRVKKDCPGFIVNRVLVPLINEAGWIVSMDEGSIESIDSTVKFSIGLPMGAFELADQVGIDVVVHVLEYLHDVIGDQYAPSPLLKERVRADELGKKSGRGFYGYDSDVGVNIPPDAIDESILERLLAVMANETAKLVGEGVADVETIDHALEIGASFPDGPGKLADFHGLDTLKNRLDTLNTRTGAARYEIDPTFHSLIDEGGFYQAVSGNSYETIRIERLGDYVAKLVIDRPHRMNSINRTFLSELEAAIGELERDDDVRCLLIVGAGGRAFSAGADLHGIAAGGSDGFEAIELSRTGHRSFGQLETTSLIVIAGIDGYCLGGGMELAACADLRVATERSEIGQTEMNLGLLPGWGGTQRLSRLIGESRAKEIIFSGTRYDAETLHKYGFINELVSTEVFEERTAEFAKELAAGPPLAQSLAKRAMHTGRDDLQAGLEFEATAFGHLMSTEDLLEGVTAFMEDRDPEFIGK